MGLLIGVVVLAALNGLAAWNLRRLLLADERGHLRNAALLLVAGLIMQLMATAMAGVSYLHEAGRQEATPITTLADLSRASVSDSLLVAGAILPSREGDEWAHGTDHVLMTWMRVQLEDGVLQIRPTVFRGGERYRIDEYGVRAHAPVVVEGYAFDHDDGSRALEGMLYGGTVEEYLSFQAWDPYPPLAAALIGLSSLLFTTFRLVPVGLLARRKARGAGRAGRVS